MPWVGLGVRPERLVADGRGWGKAAQVGARGSALGGGPHIRRWCPFVVLRPSVSSRLWSALVQHETVAASRHWPRMHARGARPSFVVLGKVVDDPSCTAQLHTSRPRTVRLPHKPRLWGSRPRLDRLPPVRPLEQSPLTVGSCLRTVNRRRYGRGARRSRAATRAKRPSRTPRRTGTPSRSRSRGWPPRRRAAGLPRPRRADAATAASA
jgi:hypothetical protein